MGISNENAVFGVFFECLWQSINIGPNNSLFPGGTEPFITQIDID